MSTDRTTQIQELEYRLQRLVDDEIDETERKRAEEHLDATPRDAERVAAYQRQNEMFAVIRDNFEPETDDTVVVELQRQLKKSMRRHNRRFRAMRYAAAVAVFVMVGASGLWVSENRMKEEVTATARPPVPYFPVGGGVVRATGSAFVDEGEESLAWLAKHMVGTPLSVPRLEDHELRLVSGIVLHNAEVPAIRLVYIDQQANPHFLFVGLAGGDTGRLAFPFVPEGYLSINWRHKGLLFALTGPIESKELLGVMHSISDSMIGRTPAPGEAPISPEVLSPSPTDGPIQSVVDAPLDVEVPTEPTNNEDAVVSEAEKPETL